jgi:hypothetical protein
MTLIATLAFLVGSLTASLAATWLSRHKDNWDRRRLAELDNRLRAVEYLYRAAPPVIPVPPVGRGW